MSGFGCPNVPISVVKVFWKCKTQVLFCFGFNLELNIHPDTRVVSGDNKHFCIWSVCRWLKRMSEAFAIRWLISANKSYCVRVHVWRQSINKIRDYWGIPTATTSSTATTLKNRNNQIIAKYKLSKKRNWNVWESICTKISTNGPPKPTDLVSKDRHLGSLSVPLWNLTPILLAKHETESTCMIYS